MQPAFTVVIPTYNSSSYITETLESIQHATKHKNYEVIIIDDKSQDAHELVQITSKYHNVQVILKKQKSNAADSRNIGYLNSRARFVFFLDSDDSYLPKAIDKRLTFHKQYNAGVIFGNFLTNYSNYIRDSNLPLYKSQDMRDYIFIQGGDFRSSVISIDKKYYKESLFDSNSYKHQDWIFAIRCWQNAENILFDTNSITVINETRSFRMSSKSNISASEYFCNNYLKSTEHINAFSKGFLLNAIFTKDYQACKFFASKYSPSTKIDELYLFIFKAISHKNILPFISISLNSLRKIKRKTLFNR